MGRCRFGLDCVPTRPDCLKVSVCQDPNRHHLKFWRISYEEHENRALVPGHLLSTHIAELES